MRKAYVFIVDETYIILRAPCWAIRSKLADFPVIAIY